MFADVMLAYGGLDAVVVTAGVFVAPDKSGHIEDRQWALTFGINVTGAYIVADEAYKIFKKQGLPGNIVLTTSANAVVAKKGSLAYDTGKAAANHLVRELAIEMAPLVRVNAVAPATVVKGSTMFPRDRVIASLTKYNIPFDDTEETEGLRDKLAQFYAKRSLTQKPIEPEDQALIFPDDQGLLNPPSMFDAAEATVTGNVLVQAVAAGRFDSLTAARQHVRENVQTTRFEPGDSAKWESVRRRFNEIEASYVEV